MLFVAKAISMHTQPAKSGQKEGPKKPHGSRIKQYASKAFCTQSEKPERNIDPMCFLNRADCTYQMHITGIVMIFLLKGSSISTDSNCTVCNQY